MRLPPVRPDGRGQILVIPVSVVVLATVVGVVVVHQAVVTGPTYWATGLCVELGILCTGLGAVIVRRADGHRIGWLFFAIGCIGAAQLAVGQTALWIADNDAAATGLAIFAEFLRYTNFAALIVLLAVFPTGHLLSPRWRWPIRGLAVFAVGGTLEVVSMPGPIADMPGIRSPIRFAGQAMLESAIVVAAIFLFGGVVTAVCALVVRFRRSNFADRQQIKLFVFAAVGCVALIASVNAAFPREVQTTILGDLIWNSPGVILPTAAAFAILRHGLFDIDRVVSRTVAYALVTVLLAGVFAVVIVLPGLVAGSGGHNEDWMIALATLVVAGSFRPVRRRVQNAVDHRFNRRRYDAEHTIELFSRRLRHEIDIDALVDELRSVVAEAMQPTHVSLWVRR